MKKKVMEQNLLKERGKIASNKMRIKQTFSQFLSINITQVILDFATIVQSQLPL